MKQRFIFSLFAVLLSFIAVQAVPPVPVDFVDTEVQTLVNPQINMMVMLSVEEPKGDFTDYLPPDLTHTKNGNSTVNAFRKNEIPTTVQIYRPVEYESYGLAGMPGQFTHSTELTEFTRNIKLLYKKAFTHIDPGIYNRMTV